MEKITKTNEEWKKELTPEQFEDAPATPTGKRFCINSCALDLKKKE